MDSIPDRTAITNEDNGSRRRVSAAGIALICDEEQLRLKPYLCATGHWSIGYGHVIREHEAGRYFDNGITEADARTVLANDLAPVEIYLTGLFPSLEQYQFDALAALIHNIGLGAFDNSTLKRKLSNGDIVAASAQFLVWDKGRVNGPPLVQLGGLVNRRHREKTLFDTGVDPGRQQVWQAMKGVVANG